MSADQNAILAQTEMPGSSVIAVEASMEVSTMDRVPSVSPTGKTQSKRGGNSPKCVSREQSRPHSPSVDKKRRSKHGSPVGELGREGGEDAPFRVESAAGSGYSSPYSERATPPHLRWAKSLEDVLDDYEGMELFKQYLTDQNESHLLDFWYACKGFKKLDAREQDRIRIVADRLFHDYVAPRGKYCLSCLTSETRCEIRNCLKTPGIDLDQTMYDVARDEVLLYLRGRHAQFATSDTYILYIQDVQAGGWDSPKCYSHEVHSNNSSSSGEARRPSALLPTVHEDAEFESESERLTANANTTTAADTTPAVLTTTETMENTGDGTWRPTVADKPFPTDQTLATSASATVSTSSGQPAGGDDTVASVGGVKRRAAPPIPPTATIGQQIRPTGLTPHTLAASFGHRLLATKPVPRVGLPPHPYHTPYMPYLPTSAQDSELQSMSSDATTESGFSGANYQRKEHHIMRQHLEHNRELAPRRTVVPRTVRQAPADPSVQDMRNPDFCRRVKEKLERVKREQEHSEKLAESIKRLSEPENGHNDHRAAVNKFYSEERSRQGQIDDAEAILDDYCSRVPYFKDSPKQSPLRSPGFAGIGRRRSPVAKSPIRAMIASYPSAAQPAGSAFIPSNTKAMAAEAAVLMSQSVVQSSRSGKASCNHSAGNTIHRAPKHEQFSQIPAAVSQMAVDKRSGAILKKTTAPRYPPAPSDSSGISSGTSAEPSLVCARLQPNLGQRGVEHWVVDKPPMEMTESDGTRHRTRNTNAMMTAGSSADAKSHRSSGHRAVDKANVEKSRGQKFIPDGASVTSQKTLPLHGRRSEAAGLSSPSHFSEGVVVDTAHELTVGIFLPNENTPYLVRFPGRQITLKQFKQLVPRKGNFRYFFQCVSDELGTGTVQREVVQDNEVLPLCDNKVVAKIVANE